MRHVKDFFEINEHEYSTLQSIINTTKEELDIEFKPAGYNIGINNGELAGQTVFHLHIHLIPLYQGDREDPRGGVRWVLPEKADYWRQSGPYPAVDGVHDILFQNSGSQASIGNILMDVQESTHSRLSQALRNDTLIKKVVKVVKDMPLWRLQTFSNGIDDFLYPRNKNKDEITLQEGVAYCLRVFHGQIQNMVKGAWVNWISKLKRNYTILGQHVELTDFMFGSDRSDLSAYKVILKDVQSNTCFYCGKPIKSNSGTVDHFIPWARYPVDLGHNFVLSHEGCNNDKRDMLAAIIHLEHWLTRNDKYAYQLREYFNEHALNHDISTSLSITSWAYSKTESMGGDVWSRGKNTERLESHWHQLLLV